MLTIAGIGPGNPKYLTIDVKERIQNADHILAFPRVAASLKDIRQDFIKVKRVEEIINYIDHIDESKDVLLLASGDPNFFGIVNFLKRRGVLIKEILPGLSSFQYMMAKLGMSWQDARFISLHGRSHDLEKIKNNKQTVILIDKDNMPSIISKRLYDLEIKGTIYAGFNLSYDDEMIIKANIGDQIQDVSTLGVVVIENEMD